MNKHYINLPELFELLDKKFKTKNGEKKLEEILTSSNKFKNDNVFKKEWNKMSKFKSLKQIPSDAFSSVDESDIFDGEIESLSISNNTKEEIEKMVEKAEEHYKQRITSYGYTPPDMDVYHIIAKHLKENSEKTVLFGGQALDLHLRTIGTNIYEEGSIPDFDIVCDDPIKIATDVAKDIMKIKSKKVLKKLDSDIEKIVSTRESSKLNKFPPDDTKYWWIEIKQSMNKGVFKLVVNGQPVLDLKVIKPHVLDLLVKHGKVITGIEDAFSYCNGIRVLNINNLKANFYFELSEVRMPQRWEKVITRKDIVFSQFPTIACPRTKKLNNVPSTIKTIINDLKKFFAINGFSFSGITSLNFYKNWSKSERIITDILSPQLDVVFTSIKGRFLSLNKINKSVSAIIKSITKEKIYIENIIIPTMESRVYREIKKSTFYIKINDEKYALCSVTVMFTCLPYIERKINKISTKILSPLSLKIMYLYNIAYNPKDAIRNRCMLKYLENMENNFYKENKEINRLDININKNTRNLFSEAFWGCEDDDYYVFADTMIYKIANMVADKLEFDKKKKILNPSDETNRIVFLEKLGDFTKKVKKQLEKEKKIYYQDKDLDANEDKPIITLSPKQEDVNNCKSKKIEDCVYPCTKLDKKCIPIPKRSWLVFPTDGYSEGKWVGTKNKKVIDETN